MGEVTDEGVGASCQPPFACREREGGVCYFHIHYPVQLGQTQRDTTNGSPEGEGVKERSVECWDTLSYYTQPEGKLSPRLEEANLDQIIISK